MTRKPCSSLSDLDKGSVETDRSFNPAVSIPFGNQVATTVVGNAGETITAPSRAFTLGGSIGDKLNLGVEPVTDPFRLRNIAALYRYVLYGEKANSSQEEQTLMTNYYIPYQIDAAHGALTVDKSALLYPQCVICLKNPDLNKSKIPLKDAKDTTFTEINTGLGSSGWLHHDHETDPAEHSLGRYNGHYLSMPRGDYDAGRLRNLILLIMVPPPPPKSG
jgi:hypothetical protein